MLAVQQCPYMEVQISKECSTPATLIAAMSGLEVKREDDDSAEQRQRSGKLTMQRIMMVAGPYRFLMPHVKVDKGTDGLYFSDLLFGLPFVFIEVKLHVHVEFKFEGPLYPGVHDWPTY
nr:uncharacterized protein LOC120965369 isoform X1 [Aegilops tauschii subsp. strangulata]